MLVNVFKNRDDLFYAGLESGKVDNNSALILVYQSHQVNNAVFSNDFYHGWIKIGDCLNLIERYFYGIGNQLVISA